VQVDWVYWIGPAWGFAALAVALTRFHSAYVVMGMYVSCQVMYRLSGTLPQVWAPLDLVALAILLWLQQRNYDQLAGWCAIVVGVRLVLHINQLTYPMSHFWYITVANTLYGVLCVVVASRWMFMWRNYS